MGKLSMGRERQRHMHAAYLASPMLQKIQGGGKH